MEPWRSVLPAEMVSQLPSVVRRMFGPRCYKPAAENDEPAESVGDKWLSKAAAIFSELDIDNSGMLDVNEVCTLCSRLTGAPLSTKDKALVSKALSNHGLEFTKDNALHNIDNKHYLVDLDGFLKLAGVQPMIEMVVPKEVRDEIRMRSAAARSERSALEEPREMSPRSSARDAHSHLRRVFDDADTDHDGTLDSEELATILLGGLGDDRKLTEAIARFDGGTGRLQFKQFIRMVNDSVFSMVINTCTIGECNRLDQTSAGNQ